MLTIHKFPIPYLDDFTLQLPVDAKPLCVMNQLGAPQMWVLLNPSAPTTPRHFKVFGTGHHIDQIPGNYIGTFQLQEGRFIFHVFEA
jgi:hypothetical protein